MSKQGKFIVRVQGQSPSARDDVSGPYRTVSMAYQQAENQLAYAFFNKASDWVATIYRLDFPEGDEHIGRLVRIGTRSVA